MLLVGVKRLQTFAKNLRRLSTSSVVAGSSIGRTTDFESVGWRFEPSPASQLPQRSDARATRRARGVGRPGSSGPNRRRARPWPAGSRRRNSRLVLVVDDRPGPMRAHERDRHRRAQPSFSQRSPASGASSARTSRAAGVATPTCRRALDRVVQDAAAKRATPSASDCARSCARAASSKSSKDAGPFTKSVMWRALSALTPGVMSISTSATRGRADRARDERAPSSRRATCRRVAVGGVMSCSSARATSRA